MNISNDKTRFVAFIAVWLAIFMICSILSGVAYSIQDAPSDDPVKTTTQAPQKDEPPTTTLQPPLTEPPTDPSPYESLTYSADNAQYLIFLDAGHGWYDNGASVKLNEAGEYDENGEYVYEKTITLELTKKLKKALEQMGYTVGETRPGDNDSDCPVPLVNGIFYAKDRPSYVNAQGADYFISLHCNSFGDSSVSGTRIYYSDNRDVNRQLATSIHQSLVDQTDNNASLNINTQLYILLYSAMPTVLIETGFMTNMDDLNNLRDPDWQDQFVCAIALGLDANIHSAS